MTMTEKTAEEAPTGPFGGVIPVTTETVGDRLAYARKHARMSQGVIAEHFHVSVSAVSAWENGSHGGREHSIIDIIQGYSDLTGVDPGWIAGFRTGSSSTISRHPGYWTAKREHAATLGGQVIDLTDRLSRHGS